MFSLQGQTNTFQNVQGIKQEKVTFYNKEGYQIFIQEFSCKLDEKRINKVKKKYSIPKETLATEDVEIPEVKIFNSVEIKGEARLISVYITSAKRSSI